MPITVEYGPRAETMGGAGFEAGQASKAYTNLRSLMDLWTQISEAQKQREWQSGERVGTQTWQAGERVGTQDYQSREAEKQRTSEKELTEWQTRANFINQHPNYGRKLGAFQTTAARDQMRNFTPKAPF